MVTLTRVPQEERSRVMRERLLDAAVECLIECGYSGTSTTLVSERAGVSRGAQLHHFPSRADLLVAAVEHVAQARGDLNITYQDGIYTDPILGSEGTLKGDNEYEYCLDKAGNIANRRLDS